MTQPRGYVDTTYLATIGQILQRDKQRTYDLGFHAQTAGFFLTRSLRALHVAKRRASAPTRAKL